MNARERFLEKIQPIPMCGCWAWEGYVDAKMGYGMFWLNGSMQLSHRVSYMLFNGDIPSGLNVLHRCDVPCCVNPNHLWLGTNDQNVKDKVAKGRAARLRGTDHPAAKVDESIVRMIRCSPQSARVLAQGLSLDRSTVQYIRQRKLWSHVQ